MRSRTLFLVTGLLIAGSRGTIADEPPQRGIVAPPQTGLIAPAPQWRVETERAAKAKTLPWLDLVQFQLSKTSGYRNGDLITAGDVEPILKELAGRKWSTKELAIVRAKLVPDSALIAREFRTPNGRQFMRQSGRYQMGYDRIDRLSQLSDGPTVLWRLMNGPDGYKLIEYMATAPGGQQLGRMLSRDPKAGNFNAPTGRIYTADQLVAALEEFEPE
ncbi:MAG TPA: hypothetical protein VHV77_11925 [Pirellulales bacterium]|nr:hypothetical protein [Pirellulales bacterium]